MIGALAIGAAAVGTVVIYNSNLNNDKSLYAASAPQQVCTTVLNYENVGVSGTTYTDWTYPTGWDYKIIGQSAGGNNSIQLRSKNSNSGIITQKTTLYCYRIEVDWNENTAEGRILDIYGRNDGEYKTPSDLYSNSKEKIGSIARENQTTFDINYAYANIGLRSRSDAMYLNSITFYWTNSLPSVPEEPEQSSEESISSSEEVSDSSLPTEEVVNWTPVDLGLNDTTNVSSVIIGYTTITLEQESGSTHPRYWAADYTLRVYDGNTATITSTKPIKSIVSSPNIDWVIDGSTFTLSKTNIASITITYIND